jgi:hypothetical protein
MKGQQMLASSPVKKKKICLPSISPTKQTIMNNYCQQTTDYSDE